MSADFDDLQSDLFCSIVGDMADIALKKMPSQFCHIPVSNDARLAFAQFVSTASGIAALCILEGTDLPFADPRETTNGAEFYQWLSLASPHEKTALVLTCLNSKFGEVV